MADAEPLVSVVVVSWNTCELLANCLASLDADPGSPTMIDGVPAEVVVVDNASSDASAQMVRTLFPWVRMIVNHTNVGFARANNQAFAVCRGEYLLLLNPDTEVQPEAIATLLAFVQGSPGVAAAGPRLVYPDGSLQVSCYPAPSLGREVLRLLHLDAIGSLGAYRMGDWALDRPKQVDVIQGACLLVTRSALNEIGEFDEQYFIYSEEVDFCKRLHSAGWRIYWVPQATVVHHSGQSTRLAAAAMFVRLHEGKILYFRKHEGPGVARLYKTILLLASPVRLMLVPLAFLGPSARRTRRLLVLGYYVRLLWALPRL